MKTASLAVAIFLMLSPARARATDAEERASMIDELFQELCGAK